MSAEFAWSPAVPERVSAPRRILRSLPKPGRTRASLPVIASCAVVAVVLVQLLLSVVLAGGAYEVEGLESTKAEAVRSQTAATQELLAVQSPQYLVKNANALGMVANSNTVYLRLSDGAVIGQPKAAKSNATLAGDNIANSLMNGIPLAGQAASSQAENSQATAATPTGTADQAAAGSVALQSGAIPAQQTH